MVRRDCTALVALAASAVLAGVAAVLPGCGGGEQLPSASASWDESEVSFTSGPNRLFGILASPTAPGPHPGVVLITGSGGGGVEAPLLRMHAFRLARAGFAVLRFDPPGVGRSGGEQALQTLQARAQEALAAADFLRSQRDIDRGEVGLWGESQGGWVTQMAAAASPEIAFLVSVSGSGVPVGEQQVYSVEAQSRAAGFTDDDVAKATLFARLLVDWQLSHDRYRDENEAEVRRLGPGLWRAFAAVVYPQKPLPAGQSLARTIALLERARTRSWARFLYLDTVLLPALERIPPARAEAARTAAEQSLLVDPKDFLTAVRCPVLALFGKEDKLVPAVRSARLYTSYLRQARNEDATVIVLPGVGHSLGGFGPGYWTRLTDWLSHRTSG